MHQSLHPISPQNLNPVIFNRQFLLQLKILMLVNNFSIFSKQMSNSVDANAAPIKVYFRSSSKHAKIAYFPALSSTDQLYIFASKACGVPADRLHLFLHGSQLLPASTIQLDSGAILHMVKLDELKKEIITVIVKKIQGDNRTHRVEIDANTLIRRFVDDRLRSLYGQEASGLFLVHMGRQLNPNRTFRQEEVEDGSEIICLSLRQPNSVPSPKKVQAEDDNGDNYQVRVPVISQLETPEAPKDIYPTNDFVIGVPQGIETNNNLNLIFDYNVRRASSIRNIDLDPSEIIAQEDSFTELNHHNKSYQSENEEEHRQKESHFSEKWKRSEREELLNGHQEELERVNVMGGHEGVEFKAGDLIYAGDLHMLPENNIMGTMIHSYMEKLVYPHPHHPHHPHHTRSQQ